MGAKIKKAGCAAHDAACLVILITALAVLLSVGLNTLKDFVTAIEWLQQNPYATSPIGNTLVNWLQVIICPVAWIFGPVITWPVIRTSFRDWKENCKLFK